MSDLLFVLGIVALTVLTVLGSLLLGWALAEWLDYCLKRNKSLFWNMILPICLVYWAIIAVLLLMGDCVG